MPKAPTKAELASRLRDLEAELLTRRAETVLDFRSEPSSTLPTFDADHVFTAITQAELGDTRLLFATYRDVLIADSHIQSCLEARFLPILGDEPVIAPINPEKPDDVAAADAIRAAIDRRPDFNGLCADLLWGIVWPLSLVERTYRAADVPGLTLDWGEFVPVPDHLFRFVNGCLEVAVCDPVNGQPTGRFVRPDASRYITHRGHLLSRSKLPDNWGGPMRALLWWFLLKTQDREWWARFLDRFGTPFPVGKFEKSDDRSRQILERAFRLAGRIGGLAVSSGTAIELIQANTGAADAHEKFFRLCNDEISRRILGQTLSSTASPQGLGNGASDLQGQVRGDMSQNDKKRLAQTLREQLFKPFLRLNHIAGAVPNVTFGGEEPEENSTTAEVLSKLKTAGLRLADKSLPVLSKRVGLEIERDPAPAPAPAAPGAMPALTTRHLSALPTVSEAGVAANSISREAAARLSRIYRGSLAPVRQVVLDSAGPDECLSKLLAVFVDWSPERAAEVVEAAVVAGAWDGCQA
jgi:phage gp29-like protein